MVNSGPAQNEPQYFAINNIQDAFDILSRGFEVYSQATNGTSTPKAHNGHGLSSHRSASSSTGNIHPTSTSAAATSPAAHATPDVAPQVAGQKRRSYQPDLDITESPESITIDVSLPGVDKSAINIEYDSKSNHVLLSGDFKQIERAEDVRVIRHERPVGKFERVVVLGQQVILPDQISAQYTDGVLIVTVPKNKEAEIKKKISVQ